MNIYDVNNYSLLYFGCKFFDYLLLIVFDNEYVTEKSNLDLVLSKKYNMTYYFFDTICDLISNNK